MGPESSRKRWVCTSSGGQEAGWEGGKGRGKGAAWQKFGTGNELEGGSKRGGSFSLLSHPLFLAVCRRCLYSCHLSLTDNPVKRVSLLSSLRFREMQKLACSALWPVWHRSEYTCPGHWSAVVQAFLSLHHPPWWMPSCSAHPAQL